MGIGESAMTNELETKPDLVSMLVKFAANVGEVGQAQLLPCALDRMQIRSLIMGMEQDMRAAGECGEAELIPVEQLLPLRHMFAPGMYGREVQLSKFNWVIGKIHRHAHLNFVSNGKVIVLTEDGPMIITAPYSFVSSVGTKRFVLALEDTIWATVHANEDDTQDLAAIEDRVIAKDYEHLGIIENETQEKLS